MQRPLNLLLNHRSQTQTSQGQNKALGNQRAPGSGFSSEFMLENCDFAVVEATASVVKVNGRISEAVHLKSLNSRLCLKNPTFINLKQAN